jgi:hypothetical protein
VERNKQNPVRLPGKMRPERRAVSRFPLVVEVSYTVTQRRVAVETGSGTTIDLSSHGLCFIADQPLRTGQKLEVSIDWPGSFDSAIKLQVVISGVVVRTNKTLTALQIKRHELRIRRVGPKAVTTMEPVD